LKLAQNVLLPGQTDGGYQDDRSRSHGHSQGRKHELQLVAAEGVVGKVQDLTSSNREAALSRQGRRDHVCH
jgi:hypothetical protein